MSFVYFFRNGPIDIDNLPNLILDTLKGKVFSEDSQVINLLCRKGELNDDLRILDPLGNFLECIHGATPVVHIAVRKALSQEVVL